MQQSLYIMEYRTPLSPRRPLIGLSRDFPCEHGSSRAWKWSTSDVDCSFLIKVTRENSVTLTLHQQRRRPAGQPPPPPPAAAVYACAVLEASAMIAPYGTDHAPSCAVDAALKMICNDFLVVKVNCWSYVFNIIQSIRILRNIKDKKIAEKSV